MNSGVGLPSMLYSILGIELGRDQRGQLTHVGAADVPFVGARVHGDAVCTGAHYQARRLEHARIADVALIAEQRDLVQVDAELGLDRLRHRIFVLLGSISSDELAWLKGPIQII